MWKKDRESRRKKENNQGIQGEKLIWLKAEKTKKMLHFRRF